MNCPTYGPKYRELKNQADQLRATCRAAVKLAESEKRDLSDAESKEVDEAVAKIEKLNTDMDRLEKLRSFDDTVDHSSGDGERHPLFNASGSDKSKHTPETIRDVDGREMNVFRQGQSMAAFYNEEQYPDDVFGRFVAASVTGKRKLCPEFKAEMTTTSNVDGGMLVPEPLERIVIDRIRNTAVLTRAGARFVDLVHGETKMATITSGATFTSVGENEEISTSKITFGCKQMVLRKRAVLIPMSVELLEDSYNAGQIIQDAVARDAAEDFDKFIIQGTDGSYTSLVSTDSIDETGSVGAIAWEDFHNIAVDMRAANEEPNAYIVHPTIAGDCDLITTGDGSTSAKNWLGAPPTLAGINRLQTGNMPLANAIMGDFSQLLIGTKPGTFRIEITREGEFFKKDQVCLKVVYRLDYVLTRSTAFRRLAGITS